jgi:hypothetical protein
MSRLSHILEDQLAEARLNAGTKIHRKLKSGLHIVILCRSDQVIVSLWRADTHPSLQEWDTVMKHFPYNTPSITPEKKEKNGKFAIVGTVPTQRIMQMKFG